MLYALMEGLAGIVDLGTLFRRVRLSPRWVAAGIDEAEVEAVYGASGASLAYHYRHHAARSVISIDVCGKADALVHVLVPTGSRIKSVQVNGRRVPARPVRVEESTYADAVVTIRDAARIDVTYAR
jgi:hypothetical protein